MASEGDKYITSGVWLRCDKGAAPSMLKTLPKTVQLYGKDWATHLDAVPVVNIPSFGACLVTHGPCMPVTVMWANVMESVSVLGQSPLLDVSTCQCTVGGSIKIFFTQLAALSAGSPPSLSPEDAAAEQEAKEDAHFWGNVGKGLLIAAAVVGAAVIIAGTGGAALAVLGAAAASGAAVGGVGGAVAGGISGGPEGALEGFFQGAAYGALGGIALASGAGAVAAGLAGLGAVAGVGSLGFLGKAYYHNPSKENGLVLVGAAAGMAAGGLMAKGISIAARPKTSTVYRAQGGTPPNASWKRVKVNEEGNVRIQGDRDAMLHISLDDKNHTVYFYNKRGGAAADAEIVSFKVPKKLADEIRGSSVPQDQGRTFPGAPQKVDPTRSSDAYGVRGDWIDRLERGAIPGSGRVIKPK